MKILLGFFFFFFAFSCRPQVEENNSSKAFEKSPWLGGSVGSFRPSENSSLLYLANYEEAKGFTEQDLQDLAKKRVTALLKEKNYETPLSKKESQEFFKIFYDLQETKSFFLAQKEVCKLALEKWEGSVAEAVEAQLGKQEGKLSKKNLVELRAAISQEASVLFYQSKLKKTGVFAEDHLYFYLSGISHPNVCQNDPEFKMSLKKQIPGILKEESSDGKTFTEEEFHNLNQKFEAYRYKMMADLGVLSL